MTEQILEYLNPPQREAVLHTEGPLLILAGAGSGKTRVLTHRIAWLIQEAGIAPWNILAITFTNKAAGEMRSRVDQLVGIGSEEIWVSTFHACCARILRRHIDNLGFSGSFVIYDTDDQKSVMKEIFRRRSIDTKRYKEKGILASISRAKEEGRDPSDLEKEAHHDEEDLLVASLYRDYQEVLRSNNALDFDDLLLLTVRLFRQCPEILANYQERFQYIMVDEYQDTNNIQFQFVSLLASRYRNLCVVGDDDQSIYSFRGADIRNILDFEDTFPDTKVIRLEQNYRSTGMILNAANEVIRHNKDRKSKTLWTENPEGSKIYLRRFDNGLEEAEYVVGEIDRSHRMKDIPYRDFAVLYRTNAQSRLFEEKLIAAGIPYQLVGGVNFYARKEIKDLLCYLRVIENPSDDLAVARIVNVPKRGIGATTMNRVQSYAADYGLSLYKALETASEIPGIGRGVSRLTAFITFIQELRAKAIGPGRPLQGSEEPALGSGRSLRGSAESAQTSNEPPQRLSVSEILKTVIAETGYVDELKAERTQEAESRIENIDELINTTASYEINCREQGLDPSLNDFLAQLALVSDLDRTNEEEDHVLLLTLHSAKGLEFPRVFIAGMDEGLFPGYGTIFYGEKEDMEEERRLCYVGITRAMQELTLTSARRRLTRGEYQDYTLSRFVQEIPREIIDMGENSGQTGRRRFTVPDAGQLSPIMNSLLAGGREDSRTGTALEKNRDAAGRMNGITSNENRQKTSQSAKEPFSRQPFIQTGSTISLTRLDYGEGDMVRHIKFGIGKVLSVKPGPRDFEVTVEFERYGIKKMFAGFAKLVKI